MAVYLRLFKELVVVVLVRNFSKFDTFHSMVLIISVPLATKDYLPGQPKYLFFFIDSTQFKNRDKQLAHSLHFR